MEREDTKAPVAVELGTLSGDTLGNGGPFPEGYDQQFIAGLSDD